MLELDDDIAFDKLYADKREREMLSLLKQIVIELKKDNGGDAKVSDAIEKNNESLNIFIQKIQQLQKQQLPDITIENKEVAKEINDLSELSKQIIENQKIIISIIEKKPLKLKINRNNDYGDPLINSIEIDYGLITYKK